MKLNAKDPDERSPTGGGATAPKVNDAVATKVTLEPTQEVIGHGVGVSLADDWCLLLTETDTVSDPWTVAPTAHVGVCVVSVADATESDACERTHGRCLTS